MIDTGWTRFHKSFWKPFKTEFGLIEDNLESSSQDVDEEIRLASEMEHANFRRRQITASEQSAQMQTRMSQTLAQQASLLLDRRDRDVIAQRQDDGEFSCPR